MAQVGTDFRPLDAAAVRDWCAGALEALGRERERIDAINVFPVADGDTGTNLYLTVESAARAVEAAFEGADTADRPTPPTLAQAAAAMAHGALIGARGNSGTILAQLLRGMAQVLARDPADRTTAQPPGAGGPHLAAALRSAADAAYAAVAHPVEGTVLTVATAAATAAEHAAGRAAQAGEVAAVARDGAATALGATPDRLAPLREAGVVDAGGQGLVTVLAALAAALAGHGAEPDRPRHHRTAPTCPVSPGALPAPGAAQSGDAPGQAPHYEVIYLLEADDEAVDVLRARLDALGDSLVVVGGDGLWNVHVHVADAGAAVEAGIEAGRPHRLRVTHLPAPPPAPAADTARTGRAVVAVVSGEGLGELCRQAGATALTVRPGEPPASGELVAALRQTGAREGVLLLDDPALRHTAAVAAREARTLGVRVAVLPTRAAVQSLAALAVHAPDRGFDEDVVAMTSAAGATRYAEVTLAETRSWTMAGVCQAGDVLGLVDGDVVLIGGDLAGAARQVLDRMLSVGGELVTLVLGEGAPQGLGEQLQAHVRAHHLAVDTVVYEGGRHAPPLLIGVE
ncbi:DAK2 domain-containing protein [Streptomyces sp. NPDC059740]|uniref:DAK2 domain-containing protein n=1 Tax=Streptomyces sp. NPDC059740 TaxID=3346926 RepID=UPI003654AD94